MTLSSPPPLDVRKVSSDPVLAQCGPMPYSLGHRQMLPEFANLFFLIAQRMLVPVDLARTEQRASQLGIKLMNVNAQLDFLDKTVEKVDK